jgi:aspartyl-tRNA(Asn)/glutamyl-tRNA(Gln) amidotransferase subunit C
MSIDKSTVSKIANLARIKVTEEDLEYYAPQLQNILSWQNSFKKLTPQA